MNSCVLTNKPILEILLNCDSSTYEKLLLDKKISKQILLPLVELAYNLLYSSLPLTEQERKSLQSCKNFIREVAHRGSAKSLKVRTKKLGLIRKHRSATRRIITLIISGSLHDVISQIPTSSL